MTAKRLRVQRDSGEAAKALGSQYGFLVRSAEAFDQGAEDEAVRLAVTCRVLFSKSGGKSLMQQLRADKTITLPDTAILHERSIGPFKGFRGIGRDEDGNEVELFNDDDPPGGLVVGSAGPSAGLRWAAPLDTRMQGANWVVLSKWLSEPAIRSSTGAIHCRWDLIRVLANQDGGAHVDPTIEAEYAELRADMLGVVRGTLKPGLPKTFENVEWHQTATNVVEASMRQIAHEAIRALETHFPAELSLESATY